MICRWGAPDSSPLRPWPKQGIRASPIEGSLFDGAPVTVEILSMADPFFAQLAESGWHVPANQRIAYLVAGRDAVPGGGVRIKILGLPSGRHCAAKWQLAYSPRALGRRGQNLINTRYVAAETLDDALKAATAEAERIVEQFQAAHVQSPKKSSQQVAVAHVQPVEEEVEEEDQGRIADPRQGDLAIGKRRNGYRRGKRTATVVLDVEMHERLAALARSSGRTMQALLVEGAEMVLAHLQER